MKKTISITLGGIVYTIEEDAYHALDTYLQSIKRGFAKEGSVEELLADIEASISEKFAQKLQGRPAAITLSDVEEVITIMGHADEIIDEKDPSGSSSTGSSPHEDEKREESEQATYARKRLYRNPDDEVIGGVCSGVAAYFGVDPVWIRLVFVAMGFFNGFGILLYVILWVSVPLAETSAQKLEMQGKPINVAEIQELLKKKSEEISKEGKEALERMQEDRSVVRRMLDIPVQIAGKIFQFFRGIWLVLVPAVRIIIGAFFLIASLAGLFATTVTASLLAFGLRSPLLTSDIPLNELRGEALYYVGLGGLYLVLLIPLVFVVIGAVSLLRGRNAFRWSAAAILIAAWMIAAATTAVAATEFVPLFHERIIQARLQNTVTKTIPIETVQAIQAGGRSNVKITRGDVPSLIIRGHRDVVESMTANVEQGVLSIDRSEQRQACLFCFQRSAEAVIVVPELASYHGTGSSYANIQGFSQDLLLSLDGSADATVIGDHQSVTATLRGYGSHLTLNGMATSIHAIVADGARLEVGQLQAEELLIEMSDHGYALMKGRVHRLIATLRDVTRLRAEQLQAEEVQIIASDHASAVIQPRQYLAATSTQYGRVEYLFAVSTSTIFTSESGRIERRDDDRNDRENRP